MAHTHWRNRPCCLDLHLRCLLWATSNFTRNFAQFWWTIWRGCRAFANLVCRGARLRPSGVHQWSQPYATGLAAHAEARTSLEAQLAHFFLISSFFLHPSGHFCGDLFSCFYVSLGSQVTDISYRHFFSLVNDATTFQSLDTLVFRP